jgi:PAS domain S-box-containing protein
MPRLILDHMPVMLDAFDENGIIIFWNRECERVTGYAADEIVGRPDAMERLYPDRDYRESMITAWAERGDDFRDWEWNVTAKDGTVRTVSWSNTSRRSPVPGWASWGIGVDVTDRCKAERTLRQQARILDQIRDYITVTDLEGRITYVNRAACEGLGKTGDQLLGQSVTIFGEDPHRGPTQQEIIRRTREEGEWRGEMINYRADGSEVILDVRTWRVLDQENRAVGLCGVSTDITRRRQDEEERRRLEARMQHTQKLESLGVLAGGIAHDFNNLLVGILGHAELGLEALPLTSVARRNLEQIQTAAKRCAEICNQMLAYSGKGRFVVEALDLNQVVKELVHLLELAISRKATLRFRLSEPLPSTEADAAQIRQVIMNLITNASESLGESDGVICLSTRVERWDSTRQDTLISDAPLGEGDYLALEVADTGCGMDPDTVNRMFDPFFSTKMTGRGLGLSAVLGIVRSHQGAIQIQSQPGQGTTIKVLLPASIRKAAQPAASVATSSSWRGSGTVLLVDDDQVVRAVGSQMQNALGFSVKTARDGDEAVRIFEQHGGELACVILDLTMPRLDGEATFHALRRIRDDVPVILSSGYNEQEITNRFVGGGLAGFIQKPYQLETLRARLEQALGRRRK